MASIIEGYTYDIFISYRQKDNKYDGWVTEFVDNLKWEIDATFKEDISVYFDINPHDGLLETHDVNASLKEKLKCLIFIPIISQTYCDSKSFAWQHEFCAFNKLAKNDKFGRDIRLVSGNVASRILPVKIHELDADDLKTFENETGGVLRAIEFIYKETGVNRPLSPDDDAKVNLNRTKYRNQVNKVANAIKEIIFGIKNFGNPISLTSLSEKIFKETNLHSNSKSIAVLPFKNISPDKENEYFSDGITEEIINALANIAELRVIARTSAFMFKGKSYDVREIGKKLNVVVVLEGSVRKVGEKLRITAQLIDAANGYHLWSDRYDGTLNDIFDLQERLARSIVDSLSVRLTSGESSRLAERPIDDPRVYEIYLRARQEAWSLTAEGLTHAISLVNQARSIVGSPAFFDAALGLFHCLAFDFGISHNDQTLKLAEDLAGSALTENPELSLALYAYGWVRYKRGDFKDGMKFFRRAADIDRNSDALTMLGFGLAEGGRMDIARQYADEAIARDPLTWISHLPRNAISLFEGRFEEAISFFQVDATQLAHDEPLALWWLAQAYAFGGREDEAIELFERVDSLGAGVFSPLSLLFASALRNDYVKVLHVLETSDLRNIAMTDEYYPTQIAAALVRVGEKDEAITWLERALSWGFSNHRWLSEHNRFLKPLCGDPRFEAIMEKAREQEQAIEV